MHAVNRFAWIAQSVFNFFFCTISYLQQVCFEQYDARVPIQSDFLVATLKRHYHLVGLRRSVLYYTSNREDAMYNCTAVTGADPRYVCL